jgi:hypothetical protein
VLAEDHFTEGALAEGALHLIVSKNLARLNLLMNIVH